MPDEIQIPDSTPQSIAPGLDAELDAALNKSFASRMAPEAKNEAVPKNDKPIPEQAHNEPKREVVQPDRRELKDEKEVKNETPPKKDEDDKALPDPETIGDAPSGKAGPTAKEGWNALKNNYKKATRIITEKDSEITKLKATLAEKATASQKELDAIKAEKAELEKYRAMVDIQADPEFVSKYDEPIGKAKNDIKESIKKLGVSQETVDAIDFDNPERMENILDLIEKNKDRFTASKIERKVREYLDLNDKRLETLDQQKNNYKETLEQKKKESFAKGAENEGRMIKHIENIVQQKDKNGNALIPFLIKREIKEGAPQGEVAQTNQHNEMVDALNVKLQSVLKMKEPEQLAEIAIAAVASHFLQAQLKAVSQQLQKLTEERNKIAAVNTEAPARKPNNPTGRNGNSEPMDTDAALASHFGRR